MRECPVKAMPKNVSALKDRMMMTGRSVVLAGAVNLVADVDADRAPPDLSRVIERPRGGLVNVLLAAIPSVKVLPHTAR